MTESAPAPPPPRGSYWVWPSTLLAGSYPGKYDGAQARVRLETFLDAGIRFFVDLTEPGEVGSQGVVTPYAALLHELANARSLDVGYARHQIRDTKTPTTELMQQIIAEVRAGVADRPSVYVHCRGGTGRTGTVVGCLLVEGGVPPNKVIDRIAELRSDLPPTPWTLTSPETDDQIMFVREWGRRETG